VRVVITMYSRIVLDPVLAYNAVYALVFVFEVVCAVFAAKHSRAVIWEECRCVSLVSFLHHNIPKQGENKAVKLFVLSGPSDGVNIFSLSISLFLCSRVRIDRVSRSHQIYGPLS
jgi:hypothetical protein